MWTPEARKALFILTENKISFRVLEKFLRLNNLSLGKSTINRWVHELKQNKKIILILF